MILSLVVAMSPQMVIGRRGVLPWYLPEDLKHFRELTTGHTVIVGRKTHEAIRERLKGPLSNRKTIVLSRQQVVFNDGSQVVGSWKEALAAVSPSEKEVFVAGGAEIYALALPYVQQAYVTVVYGDFEGDVYFPIPFSDFLSGDWESEHQTFHPAKEDRPAWLLTAFHRRSPLVNLTHARSDEYRRLLSNIAVSGVCPFCPQQLIVWHDKPVLYQVGCPGNRWLVTENRVPYANARHHFLLIGERHLESFDDLTVSDLAAVKMLTAWVQRELGFAGGALIVRFGDMRLTGATVSHLHFHLIMPEEDPLTDAAKPVLFPIG